MFTYIAILLLLSALLISPVILGNMRRRSAKRDAGRPHPPVARLKVRDLPLPQRSNYRAASVLPCENACSAALAASSKRVLMDAVPRLPLDVCDRIQECSCTYEQHSDRRNGEDRRNEFGSLSKGGGIGQDYSNQRSGLERRVGMDSDLDKLKYE